MIDQPLDEFTSWARNQVDQPVLLDYVLQKVYRPTPTTLLMLVRQPASNVPNAEIEVTYHPQRDQAYQVIFGLLPFHTNQPQPAVLRPSFATQQALMQWLKTGG